MSPREWNASAYDRLSSPQLAMGREVLERLDLQGDERVLDAGCGTGRVTELILERLDTGEVVAVDGSEAMIEHTRQRFGDAVRAFTADLLELTLDEPVDAILSTATFHWIHDLDAVDHPALRGWAGPWNFPTPAEARQRLEAAGFTAVWTWLQPWAVEPDDPHHYFATVILGSHLERVPVGERDDFVDAVLERVGEPVRVDYVRLNLLARRS
jgi:trans-aconitate 2-methyltransferase